MNATSLTYSGLSEAALRALDLVFGKILKTHEPLNDMEVHCGTVLTDAFVTNMVLKYSWVLPVATISLYLMPR